MLRLLRRRRHCPQEHLVLSRASRNHGIGLREDGAVTTPVAGSGPGHSGPDVLEETAQRRLYHFSDDGTIERFLPRPAPSDPGLPAGVRAVDAVHAPLYWFPRRCPRVYVWAESDEQQSVLATRFGSDAARILAIESSWIDDIRTAQIYVYEFDAAAFAPDDSPGHFVATTEVSVERRAALGDLIGLHARSDVELRITPRLGPLTDLVLEVGLPYRFMNLRGASR